MFAAYKIANSTESNEVSEVDGGFLQNQCFETSLVRSTSQFQEISSSSLSESESNDSDDEKKAVIIYRKPPSPKTQVYYVDNQARKEYLKMDSLPIRCLPRYRLSHRFTLFARQHNLNSTKFRRYFKVKSKKNTMQGEKMDTSEAGEELRVFLSKNPNDIDKWFQYIEYQVRLLCIML